MLGISIISGTIYAQEILEDTFLRTETIDIVSSKKIDNINIEVITEKTISELNKYNIEVEIRHLDDLYTERDLINNRIEKQLELLNYIETTLITK